MGRKAKYTFEQKLKAVLDYQSGKKSAVDIAFELDMGKNGDDRIREWSNLYKANGQEALKPKERNSSYSKEFKEQVVQDYVQTDCHRMNWQQNTIFPVNQSSFNKSSSIITIEHREIISIRQKERKQRKKNAWKSFSTVSIMIAITKKQPQNMAAAIPRSIHGYANMTARGQMA